MTEAQQFCHNLELIKLAAKAAGMYWEDVYYGSLLMPWDKDKPSGKSLATHGLYSGWSWNPLTDDGDCARLEAVLETEIQWHEDGVQAGKRSNPISAFCFYVDHGGDKNATRRAASVTFAAEVASHNAGNGQ